MHLEKCVLGVLFVLYAPHADAQLGGKSDAAFVVGAGARSEALGRATVALTGDPHSVFWNPAGLASLKGYQAAFTQASMSLGRWRSLAVYAN